MKCTVIQTFTKYLRYNFDFTNLLFCSDLLAFWYLPWSSNWQCFLLSVNSHNLLWCVAICVCVTTSTTLLNATNSQCVNLYPCILVTCRVFRELAIWRYQLTLQLTILHLMPYLLSVCQSFKVRESFGLFL